MSSGNIKHCFFWISLTVVTLIADRQCGPLQGLQHQASVAASRRHHFARRRQATNLQPQLRLVAALRIGGYGPPALRTGGYGPPALRTGGYGPPALRTGSYGPPALRTGSYGPPALRTRGCRPPSSQCRSSYNPTMDKSNSTPSKPGLNPTQTPTGWIKAGFRPAENAGCEAVQPPPPPGHKLIPEVALTHITCTSASRSAQCWNV